MTNEDDKVHTLGNIVGNTIRSLCLLLSLCVLFVSVIVNSLSISELVDSFRAC